MPCVFLGFHQTSLVLWPFLLPHYVSVSRHICSAAALLLPGAILNIIALCVRHPLTLSIPLLISGPSTPCYDDLYSHSPGPERVMIFLTFLSKPLPSAHTAMDGRLTASTVSIIVLDTELTS
ncbi:hypothetical protein K439DRAFT_1624617 [Ramaria rubella]|nr:hypothetical protein K439DRAFT_1624617 [Ramaria rubella]